MSVVTQLTDAEVKTIAESVLGHEMRDLAFEAAAVRSGFDFDDLPTLSVVARVGPGIPALEGARFARIHGALHEALLARGEQRIPHFSLARADDELPDEDFSRSLG